MRYEWDSKKNESNIEKHGISFQQAISVFDDEYALTFEDNRYEYGETRKITIGVMKLVTQTETIVATVVHTVRDKNIRLISARKASRKERNLYEQSKTQVFPKNVS